MDFRDDFPIFKNRDIAYLDSGATAQKPQMVIDAIDNFLISLMRILIEVRIL